MLNTPNVDLHNSMLAYIRDYPDSERGNQSRKVGNEFRKIGTT